MIQYRKADGTLDSFDSDNLYGIEAKGHTFTITLKHYGYDEYDFWYSEIEDVIEIRIG